MKRLRDVEQPSPLLRKAQALIESVEPLPESEQRMLRVRRELERAGRARGARLPAFGLAAGVVLFGASAFAAVRIYVAVIAERASSEQSAAAASGKHGAGHAPRAKQTQDASDERSDARPVAETLPARRSQVPQRGVHAPAAAQAPIAVQERAVTHTRAAAQPAPVEIEQDAEDSAARSRALTPNPRLARHIQVHAQGRAPTQSATARAASHARMGALLDAAAQATPAVVTEAAAASSELVHRAVKALRHDHDPALAARLLEEHRARGASGPLAEEALSLQIEAATQLGDARAQQYAREYLKRYPEGRYLGVARRALQDAAP